MEIGTEALIEYCTIIFEDVEDLDITLDPGFINIDGIMDGDERSIGYIYLKKNILHLRNPVSSWDDGYEFELSDPDLKEKIREIIEPYIY